MKKEELLDRFFAEQRAAWIALFAKQNIDRDKLYAEQDALLTKIWALPEDYDGEMPT